MEQGDRLDEGAEPRSARLRQADPRSPQPEGAHMKTATELFSELNDLDEHLTVEAKTAASTASRAPGLSNLAVLPLGDRQQSCCFALRSCPSGD